MAILKTTLLAATLGVALVAGVAACGDDDDNAASGTDAGGDATTADGGSDGGCDFNTFVTGLITNNTNMTALPSEDLGDGCTDTQTAFPDTLFQ